MKEPVFNYGSMSYSKYHKMSQFDSIIVDSYSNKTNTQKKLCQLDPQFSLRDAGRHHTHTHAHVSYLSLVTQAVTYVSISYVRR